MIYIQKSKSGKTFQICDDKKVVKTGFKTASAASEGFKVLLVEKRIELLAARYNGGLS